MQGPTAIRPELDPRLALSLLRESRRFLLCGHVRPDGDCIGAQAALAGVLEKLGREVWIVNTDPPPPQLDYLARDSTFRVYRGGALPAHDVAVMLDFCEISRTERMEPALRAASSKKLVIDHHLFHGEPWWDAAYVDARASATGLLVRRIARELGVELDARIARGVWTSIVTDTGWFKYSNTDAETFAVAGELVAAGLEPARLYSAIYQRQGRTHPQALARALARLEYAGGGRIAVVDLPRARDGEADLPDGDDVLDLLRAVERVEVVLFLRETEEGKVKLSARSKTDYDVNQLARAFGGGGHAKASGATLPGPLEEARRRVLDAAVARLAPDEAAAR
jgi:phosphoesterase RecJ-like protein